MPQTKSGLVNSCGSDLDFRIPRPKPAKRALPDCLRKKKGPICEEGTSDDFYKPGAGVLAPRGAEDGEYRAGSQRNFLKRRSGKPMSERASRLAQMKHGEGYSRGQFLTEKATAATAKERKDAVRARARQRQGAMVIAPNQRTRQQVNSHTEPSQALPDGWTQHTHEDTGRVYYCNHTTGTTQWEHPGDNIPFAFNRGAAEANEEEYDQYDSDPALHLKQKLKASKSKVDSLQSKEEDLMAALENIRSEKKHAVSLLREQQAAYQEACSSRGPEMGSR
jgi:hypothetical protein